MAESRDPSFVVPGGALRLQRSDLGVLREGEQTAWQVHETLRKVYLVGLRPRREDLARE